MTIHFSRYQSPITEIYIFADEKNLLAVGYPSNLAHIRKKLGKSEFKESANPIIRETIRQLKEYFKGDRKKFQLPLKTEGSEFQEKAWAALRRIPFGRTISYREQAEKIGSEKAVRAVGSANGRNLLSIVIPCHRVITSGGSISGYAGGAPVKAFLLELEAKSSR